MSGSNDYIERVEVEVFEHTETDVEVFEHTETDVEVFEVGLQGPPGPLGPQGPAGQDGLGLQILDVLGSVADLPAAPARGDAYLINGNGWLWNGAAWKDMGPIQGPRGKDGQIRFTGNGPPPAVIVGSEPGDIYLDLLTGDTYKLT